MALKATRTVIFTALLIVSSLGSQPLFGRRHVDAKQLELAKKHYQAGLDKYNDFLRSQSGNLAEAKEEVTKAIQYNPYFVEAFTLIAQIYVRIDDAFIDNVRNVRKAFELARHAIDLAPDRAIGYRTLADLSYSVGQSDQAAELIKRALLIDENDVEALFVLGKIKMIDAPKKSIRLFKRAMKDAAMIDKVLPHFIFASGRTQDQETHIKTLEAIRAQHPKHSSSIALAIAEFFVSSERYTTANKYYDIYLKENGNDLHTTVNVAIINYLKIKNYDRASMLLTSIVNNQSAELDDESRSVIFGHLGIIEVLQKHADAAISFLKKALHYGPNNIELAEAVAFAFDSTEQHDAALKFYSVAINEAPRNSRYYALKGEVLSQKLKRYSEAIPMFEKALALSPGVSSYHMEKAFAHYYLNHYKTALKGFDDALVITPNDGVIHYNIGCILSILERTEESLASLQRAFALAPELQANALEDPDLDNVRKLVTFTSLLQEK